MKKRKILIAIIITVVFYGVYTQYQERQRFNIQPDLSAKPVAGNIITASTDDNAKVTLLNYAFWMLHSEYTFVPEKLNLLKEIADEFKNLGEEKRYETLISLYQKYKEDTFATSYDPAYTADYQKKWWEVKNMADQGQYQNAITASNGDPFALANIAQAIYDNTKGFKKSETIIDLALKNFKRGSYPELHLIGIARAYNKLNEYEKAYDVIMMSTNIRFWGTITLPIVKYYSDKKDIERSIQLVLKTINGDGKAEALLYLSKNLKEGSEKPLDRKYVKLLDSALK